MSFWERFAKKPGNCECSHIRSAHEHGFGPCHVTISREIVEHQTVVTNCACQIYIRKEGETRNDTELAELRRLSKL